MASAASTSPTQQEYDDSSTTPKSIPKSNPKSKSKSKSQPQSRYMFVEYAAPAAQPPTGAKKRRGGPSEVRAHITKEFHRRLRVKRLDALKANPGSTDSSSTDHVHQSTMSYEHEQHDDNNLPNSRYSLPDRSRSLSSASGDDPDEEPTSTVINTKTKPRLPVNSSSESITSHSTSHNSNLQLTHSPAFMTKTLPGETMLDPFDVLPSTTASHFINQVLDHALVHSWPQTVPARNNPRHNPVSSEWFQFVMKHPIAFHSFVYGATLHLLNAHKGQESTTDAPVQRLSHKVQTINLVKRDLAAMTGPASDALIMAITILAIHGTWDDTVYPEVHPRSPLAAAQHIHVYGSMRHDEEHVRWIIYLIVQRGGLDALNLYGMADTLALCDLYFASKYSCAPSFPLRRVPLSLVESGKHIHDSRSIELNARLGTGFKYFRFIPEGSVLFPILEACCEVTVALDHYARGGPTAPDMVDLVEARNAAQHRLLCQNTPEATLRGGDHAAVQTCRLATLVYNDMVIFPMRPIQGVKPRLASLLKAALEKCANICVWDSHAYLLLWATSLGAIAATFTPDRPWYVQQLIKQTQVLGIDQWAAMEFVLSKFLWWSPVCSEPGEELWNEMYPSSGRTT